MPCWPASSIYQVIYYYAWRSKEASRRELVCFARFLGYVCLQEIRELGHPLTGFEVNLHPIADWTVGIIEYELVHTLLFVGFSWKSIPEVFAHNIVIWAPQVFFGPFQLRHIYLQSHNCIYAHSKLAYNLNDDLSFRMVSWLTCIPECFRCLAAST